MDIYEICTLLKEHGTLAIGFIILLMTFVQITPIKLNPWSWIGKKIVGLLTADLVKQIGKIEKKISEVEDKLDSHVAEEDLRDLRKRRETILDFASAIAENKRRYTKEQYQQMLSECDMYLMYCEEKNFQNAVAEESIALIRSAYSCRLKDNSFLNTSDFSCDMLK